MIVLDAGVLIALLDIDDAHHDRAAKVFSDAPAETFLVHRINLAEALVSPAREGRENEALAALTSFGVSVAELSGEEAVMLARTRATFGLKMPDSCALATALHFECQLETFDDRLAKTWNQARLA